MSGTGRYSSPDVIRSENLPSLKGQSIILSRKLDDPDAQEQWRQQLSDPHVPKIVDLFCGAGGMSEGFVNAGFVVAAAFDSAQLACDTFAANIPARVICTDIAQIADPAHILDGLDVTGVDVIVGGPPCQGFSQVGRARIKSLAQSEQDRLFARNELYGQFFRFVEALQPAFFVMENVPALLSFGNGAYKQAIEKECERLGYDIEINVLDASQYGVPQVRRRLFIIGSRIGRLFRWPRIIHPRDIVPLQDAIGDLPFVLPPSLEECREYNAEQHLSTFQQMMRSKVPFSDKAVIYDHVVRPVRQDDIVIFTGMKPGDRYTDIDPLYRRYASTSFKDKYYMLKPDAPGVTVTAHLDKDGYRYIHWDTKQHRTISVREAARIQSFGDHFRFAGSRSARFRQIGNAVPPVLAEKLAEQIRRALHRGSEWLPGDIVQFALPGYLHPDRLVVAQE